MPKKEHLKLLACPNCLAELHKIEIRETIVGFCCQKCEAIYPVNDGIPIILAEEARNYRLEYPLIQKLQEKLPIDLSRELRKSFDRTLNLLRSKKNLFTWEWEDERFWKKEYAKEIIVAAPKNWNDRIWQREFLVKELADRSSLKGKTILDVGSGEGQNFRFLLSKYCDEKVLYIATDISFEGLKLNRSRNTHRNSLYVLCSADYELPFPNSTADVLCYFGILHHTRNKCNNIQKDKRLVDKNGYVMVVEAIDRPTLRLPFGLGSRIESSAHEEHISKKKLLIQMARKEVYEPVFIREEGTPFFTGMGRFFRNIMLNHKKLFLLILRIDTLISKTIGHIIPFFGAGEILLLARRSIET